MYITHSLLAAPLNRCWKINDMVFKPFQETEPNTFQNNVIRDMGKVDLAHKAAGLSDRLLQKKVGFRLVVRNYRRQL